MKAYKYFFVLILLSLSQAVLSTPPNPPMGSPACTPPPCIPIDGGLVFLMIAGAALFLYKYFYRTKFAK